jgi:hypothetical protein
MSVGISTLEATLLSYAARKLLHPNRAKLVMGQLSTEKLITGHHAVASLINICVALANHPVRGKRGGGEI